VERYTNFARGGGSQRGGIGTVAGDESCGRRCYPVSGSPVLIRCPAHCRSSWRGHYTGPACNRGLGRPDLLKLLQGRVSRASSFTTGYKWLWYNRVETGTAEGQRVGHQEIWGNILPLMAQTLTHNALQCLTTHL